MDRRAEILNLSKQLLRTRGFNAFSHRDLATLVGIKSSSVHYYFPSKEDIGLALIQNYTEEIRSLLESLESLPASTRLDRFFQVFVDAAQKEDEWCVAGMLASDHETLGKTLQQKVTTFFTTIESWLTIQAQEMGFDDIQARRLAQTSIALLEGALLLARSQHDPERVSDAAKTLKRLYTKSG